MSFYLQLYVALVQTIRELVFNKAPIDLDNMKKILLWTTSFAALGVSSAHAADLPSTKSAPLVASAPLWTSFYAGLKAAYGFGVANNAQNYGWANLSAYNSVITAAITCSNSYMGLDIAQGASSAAGRLDIIFNIAKILS